MNRDEAKEKLKGRANGHFVVRKSSKKGKGTDAHRVCAPPPCAPVHPCTRAPVQTINAASLPQTPTTPNLEPRDVLYRPLCIVGGYKQEAIERWVGALVNLAILCRERFQRSWQHSVPPWCVL